MRIVLKGGVWKNSEDEVLKAAVSKYGLNQWPRCASLIPRKTAKQCKARWHEWLDPTIRKTEWTREEEERLLHLAKLLPAQWRTISGLVGRTPSQCVEQYERLLDAAAAGAAAGEEGGGGGGGGGGASSRRDDPRRLRPGEIDPMPELKPARPDPVDMDEDEKEMLSEARARLANTKGKKAKRKVREKVLEEARRLAVLQKLRELKAAGVDVAARRKPKRPAGIDYAVEVPFERRAPQGFHDTAGEDAALLAATAAESSAFRVRKLNEIEQERRSETEARERAKERGAARRAAATALPAVLAAAAEADPMALRKRPRMALPAPVLSLQELEDIAALGQGGGGGGASGGGASSSGGGGGGAALLTMGEEAWGERSSGVGEGGGSVMASTAVARARAKGGAGAPSRAALLEEARNQSALRAGWAPVLEGGDNVELEAGTGFAGAAAAAAGAGAASHSGSGGGGGGGGGGSVIGSVRGGGRREGATPLVRDALSINGGGGRGGQGDSASQYGGGGGGGGGSGGSVFGGGVDRERREAVLRGLAALPPPRHRLEISAGAAAAGAAAAGAAAAAAGPYRAAADPQWAGSSATVADAAAAAAGAAAAAAEEAAREAARRSAVLRHAPPPLPRPLRLDEDALAPPVGSAAGAANPLAYALGMIQDELLLLLKADAARYPVAHPAFKAPRRAPQLQAFSDAELAAARALLEDATASAQWAVEHRQGVALDAGAVGAAREAAEAVAAGAEGSEGEGEGEAVEAARCEHEAAVAAWGREAARGGGGEAAALRGFAAAVAGDGAALAALGAQRADLAIELGVCSALAAREAAAAAGRLSAAEAEVAREEAAARRMQERYRQLVQVGGEAR